MMKIKHVAKDKVYTKLDRIITVALSTLSWLSVLVIVFSAWFTMISITGYWDKPVNQKTK
jgi:hypothetical protein